jgi:hypothetical protein
VQVLAAVPLVGAPEVALVDDAPADSAARRLGIALVAADGWFSASFRYVWELALFMSLGQRFEAYGGAMALAGLLGALGGLGVGRLIDLGHGRRSVVLVYGAVLAVVLLRVLAYGNPWLATAATAAGAFLVSLVTPVLMARVYNLAKQSPCPLRFHVATEGGWDSACGLGCLVSAALIWAGLPFAAPLLLAVAGVAAAALLLAASYPARIPPRSCGAARGSGNGPLISQRQHSQNFT